jgi:hypothetical protein
MVGANGGGGHKLHGAGLKQVGVDFGNTPYQQDVGVFDTFGRNLTPPYKRDIANTREALFDEGDILIGYDFHMDILTGLTGFTRYISDFYVVFAITLNHV